MNDKIVVNGLKLNITEGKTMFKSMKVSALYDDNSVKDVYQGDVCEFIRMKYVVTRKLIVSFDECTNEELFAL